MNNEDAKKAEDSPRGGGGNGAGGPGKWIWIALGVAVVGVVAARNVIRKPAAAAPAASETPTAMPAGDASSATPEPAARGKAVPRLVDLGADKCIPCKMMTPILADLEKRYAGKLDVVFIDVWKNPDAAKEHGINLIPTQIFYDAAGKELFRHEGFFAKEDILAKWKELGVDLPVPGDSPESAERTPSP